ncbi:MAG TPA: DUF3536 domain-containing protein [Longilinea sp.]|nr:DUF3536 domain-containing protein [Longilinea sp.]
MVDKAFCIHGHFYQPPREDPLTNIIPVEEGASPFPNWNERIHQNCYRPNAEIGNFQKISFNIGATLWDWMIEEHADTAELIVTQDRMAVAKFGVGSAIAQAYNHTILPLASRRDKETQIRWGIGDFRHRFGHEPMGMWLPETAVDYETLQVLADFGIAFTILAPWQSETPDIDVTQPYRVELDKGKSISVFFYQRDLSTQISFNPSSTVNADEFLHNAVLPLYRPDQTDQFLLVASDGELYGHHQPYRERFLAHLFNGAMHDQPVNASFPALWLKDHPPVHSVRIRENTSWSCHHGVGRWEGTCDCTPQSEWKAYLRQALNQLADALDEIYFNEVSPLLPDGWAFRNEFIRVLTGETNLSELVKEHAGTDIDAEDLKMLNILMASQFERQRMFTSCGWFFDDFDRIEPRNNVRYAAQGVWLANQAAGIDLTPIAMDAFRLVKSQRTGLRADTIFSEHITRALEFKI